VRLEFDGPGVHDLAVWRPSVSTAPVLARKGARRLELRLAGDLAVVSFR
jgi:hypothetical protein